MPRHALADASTPFAQRILLGVRYPFRGAAPVTILAVAAFELLTFFPITFLRVIVMFFGWVATYTYAIECLRHTADGFADPPEVALNTDDRTSIALIVIQLTGNALAVLATLYFGAPGLLVLPVFAFVLPIMTMSLTFDGVEAALNPLTWIKVVGRLGSDYLLLFVVVTAATLLQAGALYALAEHGPAFLGTAVFYVIANYLTIYTFHLMGALIHHRHETLGYQPESEVIADAANPDDDVALLGHVNLIARDDIPGATDILTERLREGIAPVAMHTRYRELLRVQGRLPELLVHGQIWIAALVQAREERRALGVVQDCIDVDPAFLPDATITCGPLADTAAHGGMTHLALHLALGYLRTWPGDMGAPHYGLLALRMHERQREPAEAAVLGRQLLAAYPDHPLRVDIEALLDTLGTMRKVST
jgi:hypothetical protein